MSHPAAQTGKASIATLPNTASQADLVEAILRDGAVIVKDAMDLAVIDRLKADLMPYLNALPRRQGTAIPKELRYSGSDMDEVRHVEDAVASEGTKRCSSLMARSREMARLITSRHLKSICDAILLPNCARYQLNATQAIQIFPNSPAQPLHRDDFMYPMKHPHDELLVSALWALDDFTETNGATRVIPGSHRWSHERVADALDSDAISVIMSKGSAVIYLGSTVHGGGHNTATTSRLAVYTGMSLGWLRQEENQYMAVPWDIAKDYPEQVRDLMGYKMHEPLLGWVELQDPRPLQLG